jgi:hypothetical protein
MKKMPRPLALVGSSVLALTGIVCTADLPPPPGLPPLIGQLTTQAGRFWNAAPSWYCRETLRQSGPSEGTPAHHGIHFSEPARPNPVEIAHREIVSWYGFSAYRENPEAVHEIRQVVSVDGKPAAHAQSAGNFRKLLLGRDDGAKEELIKRFQTATMSDAALDFGQLVMLFTRRAVDRFTFKLKGPDLIGAQRVTVFDYSQQAGGAALHLDDDKTLPLAGTVALRDADGAPLRITVTAVRKNKNIEIRDEAEVDYSEVVHGVILPAALVHRRFVNGALRAEDRAQYTDWKPIGDVQTGAAK